MVRLVSTMTLFALGVTSTLENTISSGRVVNGGPVTQSLHNCSALSP